MIYGYVNVAQVVVEILVPTAGAAPSLGITCGNPPVGQVGTPYSHSFPATGGTPPYTFSIISGLTPPGMMFDPSTGDAVGYAHVQHRVSVPSDNSGDGLPGRNGTGGLLDHDHSRIHQDHLPWCEAHQVRTGRAGVCQYAHGAQR